MDSFISTIYVHEEFETNAETNEQERKLNVKVGYKFEKLT